jgi:hypothetical protein
MAIATTAVKTNVWLSNQPEINSFEWQGIDGPMISIWVNEYGTFDISATPGVMREFAARIIEHVDRYYPKGA